ncbi:MAG TPA: Uma2 family endonuclease [Tepidisphaeraceae bacterium]|jgi:Uma2 family endonuclease
MSVAKAVKRYTPREYYALEREAQYKSDYYDGEIFAMSGGTGRGSLIAANLVGELHRALKGKPLAAYDANLRVKISATGLRTYPDVSVYCGPIEYDPEDPDETTGLNPTILVEMLSKSTEAYDRGFKAENYRQIDSLRAYVLVAQNSPHVEVYARQGNGPWSLNEARGIEKTVAIHPINVQLSLADIYDRVTFPSSPLSTSDEP